VSSRALGSSIAHNVGNPSKHRTWQQRGGHNGYRIPDDRFRADTLGRSMDSESTAYPSWSFADIRASSTAAIGITAVEPWPEYWGNDWYDNDDVYVVYADNGYYLYNRRYPSAGIAISISM
jgi:hypothetical protein